MLARSSARAGLISSTPAAARLGDTCKPVVNRLDSILATCASHGSAATQGKRGAVAIGLRLHSCGVQPRSTAPSSNNRLSQRRLRQACLVWHTRGIFTPTNRNGASQCDPCCNAARAKGRQFCANRVVTTAARAGSDDALNAPADKAFRSLAQVTTPSDGLPDPSSCWTVQYGPSTCPLPAGSVQRRAAKAHVRTLGQGLNSMAPLPTGSPIDADTACRGGKQQSKRHETGVVSRVPCTSHHA